MGQNVKGVGTKRKWQFSEMGLFKLVHVTCIYIACMVFDTMAEPEFFIRLDQSPQPKSRYSIAVFKYSVHKLHDGSNACKSNGYCYFSCMVDGLTLRPCSNNVMKLRNLTEGEHEFILNVTTRAVERTSLAYSWFVDTIPPTATLFSNQIYTNSKKIAIDVTFSEACSGLGGLKCLNYSICIIIVGAAHVDASSLRIIKPGFKYGLDIVISPRIVYGRVIVTMADNFCTDSSGNLFTRTNSSTLTIHLDRRPVLVDLWTSVPSYELVLDGIPRTVIATNKTEDLKVFLDFSIPIKNSTNEILNALQVSSGKLVSINGGNHGNRRFIIKLKNVSRTEIIKVGLQDGSIIGSTGASVSLVAPITFLYDSTKTGVVLSTSSARVTRQSIINVIVEFTKPVFGFEASRVEVTGGRLTRVREISRALYSLIIVPVPQNVVKITVLPDKVYDISGNFNLESNQLEVMHYSMPALSIALFSFMTVGTISTSTATFIIELASENLAAIGGSIDIVAPNPALNLLGMIGHLQVFALSNWLLVNNPIEYSETTKGLLWLIPRLSLPWKKDKSTSFGLNRVYKTESANSSFMQPESLFPVEIDSGPGSRMKSTAYGLPLNNMEYFMYFLRGEPLSARNVIKKMENHNGWKDLEMNLFWAGIGVGCLVILHLLILLFLRWRTGKAAQGKLSIPRFELFLLIILLPCISQSSAFAISGGTTAGIITGAFLLSIPAAFILSVSLFLMVAIFSGSLSQYKEIRHASVGEKWYTKLLFFFTGRPTIGKWSYKERIPSSFLLRFGILFENRKGPTTGNIVRMQSLSSDDSNEDVKITKSEKLMGYARSTYIILDLIRRVGLGIISGAYASSPKPSQTILALIFTMVQLTYLVSLKPYISRGVHLVECVSLLSESIIFGLSLSLKKGSKTDIVKAVGSVMVAMTFFTFVCQIINQWHALIRSVLRFSDPSQSNYSLKAGLKLAIKGLILPFLPRQNWSRAVHQYSQTKMEVEPVGSMTATVVPVVSPGSVGLPPRMVEKTVSGGGRW